MASYSGGSLVNRNNYSTERQEKDPKSKQNEILLYRNNALVVKAERGVTLGLIKLIYSSDENNSGLLLGVRPRLSTGQVPCLITFDSTTLQLDAYDLIVHDSGSTSPSEQAAQPSNPTNTSNDQPQSTSTSQIQEKNKSMQITTTQEWSNQVPDTSASNAQDDFHSNVDESLRDVAALIPDTSKPDETRPPVNFRDDSNADNPEPDSTEMPEKFPFEPEQFDFDIKSITPVQTDSGLRWPCDRCGKDYCSASHLKRHWILHTDFRPYKCTLCDKKFPFHWDLKRHMTKHTGNKRFKCPNCDKSFNTQKELKCHSWLHTGQKLYKCQVCNHELSSSGNLKVHMRKHTGVKPYKCEFCPRAFYMMGHYQYHKMRHTGIKPYKCDICGKTFSFSLNLREHNNIHTGAKPYGCPKCEKKFAHRSTLKQHILVHGGERPYKCHICSKDFVQSSNYRMHLLTHQDKELRMQKCDLCGKELLSRRWVSKHRQRCLKKLMEGKDGKTTKTREPRQEYTCDVCSRVFKYRANFDTHCKKAHVPGAEEKKKPTSSKKTTKNKVACPICQKKFLYMNCVKKHLQKRHAGVEMAVPENMQSASNLKDSSFAITSGEDSRVVIRSSASKTNEQSQESTSSSSASQVEVIPIVQPVPTIHIQPTGNPSSSQKSVTFIFVPSTTSNTKPVKPVKSTKAVKQSTNGSSASYSVSRNEEVSKEKAPETGSQAISALKKLSAKVGIQDPNGSEEHRKTVQSKHLSALEQLNKRVGDYGSVALETVHPAPPRDQVPSQDHLASRDAQVRDLPNVVETVTSEKTDERREVTTTIVSRSVQQNQVGGNARGVET